MECCPFPTRCSSQNRKKWLITFCFTYWKYFCKMPWPQLKWGQKAFVFCLLLHSNSKVKCMIFRHFSQWKVVHIPMKTVFLELLLFLFDPFPPSLSLSSPFQIPVILHPFLLFWKSCLFLKKLLSTMPNIPNIWYIQLHST